MLTTSFQLVNYKKKINESIFMYPKFMLYIHHSLKKQSYHCDFSLDVLIRVGKSL